MSPHQVVRMDTIGVYRSVLVPKLSVPISQVADHRSGTGNKIQCQLGGHRFQRGLRVTFNTPLRKLEPTFQTGENRDMAVHTFPIESVKQSLLGGDSIQATYRLVRTYLSLHNQSGDTNEDHLNCPDRAAVVRAITEFGSWSGERPRDEPKLLWVSLHGEEPSHPLHVGVRGLSAAFSTTSLDNHAELVDWWDVLNGLRGVCPPNVVVIMDVCWGGSPSAPGSLTKRTGNPKLLFGPIRSAHRLELDTATSFILATIVGGAVPSVAEAKTVVRALNKMFPRDPETKKEFYRVWWWNAAGTHKCFPPPKPAMTRAT